MIRPGSLAILAVLLIGPARGQDPKPTAPAKAAEMTEDVEILRRLLNKSVGLDVPPNPFGLRTAYMSSTATTSATDSSSATDGSETSATTSTRNYLHVDSYPQFDGVYLKGHGIAYTVRLSTLEQALYARHEKAAGLEVTCQNCHPASDTAKFNLKAAAAVKPPTEWEKARDELRGGAVKSDPDARRSKLAEMCFPGNLTESVTKLLAANGRHVRHLAADESVSVVVTYDGVTGPAHDRTTGTMADPAPQAMTLAQFAAVVGLTTDELKQVALGDLHLKQGKHFEAVKAYEAALARHDANVTVNAPPSHLKRSEVEGALEEVRKGLAAVRASLAQAQLGAGDLDGAKRSLELAQQLTIKLSGDVRKDKGVPVPAKIVLTVKKSHLDAADKLSPAEFRKGVAVEQIGLSATKK